MIKFTIIAIIVIAAIWYLSPGEDKDECPTCKDGKCQCGKKDEGCGPSCGCK